MSTEHMNLVIYFGEILVSEDCHYDKNIGKVVKVTNVCSNVALGAVMP